MYKKALLSTMVASALILSTGCEVSSVEDNDKVDTSPVSETDTPALSQFPTGTHPVFKLLPANKSLPLTIDLLFANAAATDGTAATNDTTPPVTTAINDLDGFSLTAAIDVPFSGALNPQTVIPGSVLLVEMANSPTIDALDIRAIIAANPQNPFASPGLRPGIDYSVSFVTQGDVPVVRIKPNKPLNPATKYLVVITDQIKDTEGKNIVRADNFAFLSTTDSTVASLQGAIAAVKGWADLAGGVLGQASNGALGRANVALAYTFTTGGANSILKAMAAPVLHLKSPQLVGGATLAGALNPPKSRPFQLIQSSPGTPVALTPNDLGISPDPFTRYVQGSLTIPVGFSAPDLTDAGKDSIWRANTALGAVIDGATGKEAGTTPPKDSDGTTNVTYRYPHAALNETQNVPVLITVPGNYSAIGGQDCTAEAAKPWKVAIFTHGITVDRTASVGVGNALATRCIATVAMDLPMHGVAPLNSKGVNGLRVFNAEQNSQSYPFGLAANAAGMTINERHYNIGVKADSPTTRAVMDFEGSEASELSGTSGTQFINLSNFQRTRDNMRQAVVDMLNLAASIGAMDVTGDGTPDLNADNINYIGHSLGGILGITFVSVINDPEVQEKNTNLPKIQTAIFGNPGVQMTKLLENSIAFGPTIVGGLAQAGITQGSTSFESFFQIFQATIASADPVNFAAPLAATKTPVLIYNMVGGGDIGDDSTDLDAGIKTAFMDKYPPDLVVPNYDYFKDDNNPFKLVAPTIGLPVAQATAASSLVGTDPLIQLMGLTQVNAGSSSISGTDPIQAMVLLQKGTHSTFAGATARSTFEEIAKQMVSFISSGGKVLPIDNTNDVYAPATNQ